MNRQGVRSRPKPLTAQEAKVLTAVEAHPGLNLTEFQARTGLGRRAFTTALGRLTESGHVHRVRIGPPVLLYPDMPGIQACLGHVKALRDPRTRRLHDFLSGHEICPHSEVMEHAATAWAWNAEVTRWQLRRLEQADLVQTILDLRDHRRIMYRCLPAHPRAYDVLW